MVIDKKEHQQLLLEMFKQTQFPGQFLELAYELKKAIEQAEIKDV
jgi:hypothetical protein